MEQKIKEVDMKDCPDCEGKGSLRGYILGEGKIQRGMRECIFCKGSGKLTEARYQEGVKRHQPRVLRS